jgi:glycine/D-amino acid oxidase-like deaminating enzyme
LQAGRPTLLHSGPPIDACATDPAPPPAADVVVIGGGIVGMSTALSLAERGVSVALCEKGALAAEQSSRNWGWVRKMGRDPREMPLMLESMRIWHRLQEQEGLDLGFRRSGIVYLCATERELARRTAWLERVHEFQLDSRLLAPADIARVLPGLGGQWIGALHTPSDGRAEPQKAVPALARRARELGAKIVTQCAVRGIETKAGRVAAAVTERGTIACGSVVLAGGAWSRLFCRNLDLTLPQLKVIAAVMRVDGVNGGPESAALSSGFAFRKRADGGYTVTGGTGTVADIVPDSFRFFRMFLPLAAAERRHTRLRLGPRFIEELRQPARWRLDAVSPFERVRILDPQPAHTHLEAGLRNLQTVFPAFKGATIRQSWAGAIDATPDAIPVISAVDSVPGFHIATGFSGHGFGIGPGAGRLMADIVTGRQPIADPSAFRFSRFSDGSRLEFFTGL